MTRLTDLPPTPDWIPERHECALDQACDGCQPRLETEPLAELGEN